MAQIARNVEWWGERVAEFAATRKFLTIFLCIMLTLIGGYGAKNLSFSGDYQIFFGEENPELQRFLNFEFIISFNKRENRFTN